MIKKKNNDTELVNTSREMSHVCNLVILGVQKLQLASYSSFYVYRIKCAKSLVLLNCIGQSTGVIINWFIPHKSIMRNNYAWKAAKCIIHYGLYKGFVLGLEGNLYANKGYASKSLSVKVKDNPVQYILWTSLQSKRYKASSRESTNFFKSFSILVLCVIMRICASWNIIYENTNSPFQWDSRKWHKKLSNKISLCC